MTTGGSGDDLTGARRGRTGIGSRLRRSRARRVSGAARGRGWLTSGIRACSSLVRDFRVRGALVAADSAGGDLCRDSPDRDGRATWLRTELLEYRLAELQTYLEGIAKAIADQVEGDNSYDDDETGRVNLPPVPIVEIVHAIRQHPAPGCGGRRKPETEEAQGREDQNCVRHLERCVHHDSRDRVRHNVPDDYPARGTAHNPDGVNILPDPQGQGLATDQPGWPDP